MSPVDYAKLEADYIACTQINRLQLSKINDLLLENESLRQKLTTFEKSSPVLTPLLEIDTKPFQKPYPLVKSIACPPCSIYLRFRTPREIKSSICQLCGEPMTMEHSQ